MIIDWSIFAVLYG